MKRLFISALFFLLLAGARAYTLEQCVDSALGRNPAMAAAALMVEKEHRLQATAFDPSRTEITLKQETTGGGGPENGVYFGQEFDFPTLYAARHGSLVARSRLAETRYDIAASEMRKEVEDAFCNALYFQELVRIGEELGGVCEEFCRVAHHRLEVGEIGPLEEMNARRLYDKNALDLNQTRLDFEGAVGTLRRLTGISGPLPLESSPSPLPLTAGEFDFSSTLRGREANGEIALARKEAAEVRHELLPGIRLGATVQALIKSFNPYHIERLPFEKGNFMGFEVGVTVPLFFGAGSARIKAADAERRIALLNSQAEEEKTAEMAAQTRSRLNSLSNTLEYYRSTALPAADEMKRIAGVSYRLGDIDYLEFIANVSTAYETYRDYAKVLNEYHLTINLLNYLYR